MAGQMLAPEGCLGLGHRDAHSPHLGLYFKTPPSWFSSSGWDAETQTPQNIPPPRRTPLQGRSQARRAGRASCGNICMPLTPCPPGVDK